MLSEISHVIKTRTFSLIYGSQSKTKQPTKAMKMGTTREEEGDLQGGWRRENTTE
jgi:hypothetical protein